MVAVVVVVAACKSAGKPPASTAPPQNLAKLARGTVLAADAPPPFLIHVDDSTTVN